MRARTLITLTVSCWASCLASTSPQLDDGFPYCKMVAERHPIPTSAPEGICVDDVGNRYIAEDNRGRDRAKQVGVTKDGRPIYRQRQGHVLSFGKSTIDLSQLVPPNK